jgi:hypothetical protein
MYYEYYSRSVNRHTPHDFFSPGGNLPVVRGIELPYGSATFEASVPTTLQFTYVSMPGICHTGLYFSNRSADTVQLSPTSDGFFKLHNFDDKCFIFIAPDTQQINITESAVDALDIVYLYHDFYNYTALASASLSWSGSIGTPSSPVVIRLVTSKATPPTGFRIKMASNLPVISSSSNATFIPRHREPDCETDTHWWSETLVIMLMLISGLLILISVAILVIQRRTLKIEHSLASIA